jgi:hypothetical protein
LTSKLLVMKNICILIIITILFMGCTQNQTEGFDESLKVEKVENTPDVVKVVMGEMDGVIVTHPLLGRYYGQYLHDLKLNGVQVPKDLINVKYLLVDDGFKGSKELSNSGVSYINGETHIIFSDQIMKNEDSIKAVMYKVLTERLKLNLTEKDSRVLSDNIQSLTDEDYDKLLTSISKQWEKEFIVVDVEKGI